MGTSTVSGPFRSANGFQQLDENGVWVPVTGGGGGEVFVELSMGNFSSTPDNRYSNDFTQDPPSGPSAGTIIQLPLIEVGQSYLFYAFSGSAISAWAIQLPSIAGTDLSSFYNVLSGFSAPVATSGALLPYFANTSTSGPNDLLYLYGVLITTFRITRVPNITVPGFGTLAFFQISNTPTFVAANGGFGDPMQYPFVNVAAP